MDDNEAERLKISLRIAQLVINQLTAELAEAGVQLRAYQIASNTPDKTP